ncbi:KDF1 isoform 2 [Pongo abelii]|uniref:KDF1 isoform 2 n=1 Tax=Pongo abelii TaxID=9601 RepID=A0A2J8SIB8_PONAB|nr:KDF1 isoform 2 [Pongo abelii]
MPRPGHPRPASGPPRLGPWERPTELCLETYDKPPQPPPSRRTRRPDPKDPGHHGPESITFISGSAEPAPESPTCLLRTPLRGLPKPAGPKNTMECPPALIVHPPAGGTASGSSQPWAAASATPMLSSKASLCIPTRGAPPQPLMRTLAARSHWPIPHPCDTACPAPLPVVLVAPRSTTLSMNRTWTCPRWAVAPCRAERLMCSSSRS